MGAKNPTVDQTDISSANAAFWDELCGSSAARAWGITDSSLESLRRYDGNFLAYYPYLDRHIPWAALSGKRVLEIGLGYGTISQKLADNGALYTGLDIAQNPVTMVNHRLQQSGLRGVAVQGDILKAPFDDASFDAVVAIGCLHHTGDMRAAIAKCRDLLVPGGQLIGMVYYAYSHRQLWNEPKRAAKYLMRELGGYRGTLRDGQTSSYDQSQNSSLAPSTEFVSIRSLRRFCGGFTKFRARTENSNQEPPFTRWTREKLLATPLPKLCGLDVYWECVKR